MAFFSEFSCSSLSAQLHLQLLRLWRGRWLGLPKSLSNTELYGNNKLQLPLPFKSLEDKIKVTRAREVVQNRDSNEPLMAYAGI